MKKLIYIICVLSCPYFLHGSTSDNIDELISEIVTENVGLKVSGMVSAAEKNALDASNNLSDPELGFSHQWGQKGIGNKWSVEISQNIEWPGVYSARKKLIRSRRTALDRLMETEIHDLRLKARMAILENIYLRQKESLRRGQLNRIDSLIRVFQKGADHGEISILDLNKLKIERVNIQRALTESKNLLNENIESLATLNGGKNLGNKLDRLDSFPATTLLPMEDYIASAMRNDPGLSYNSAMADVYKNESKTLNSSMIPGLSIGYSHDYELGEHFNGISLGFTLPVFSTRHRKKEIEHREIANSLETTDKETEIRANIRKSYALVIGLDREIQYYNEALFSLDNFRLLDLALASGQISLMEYLAQVDYFLNATKGYIDMDYQRAIAFAELNQWNYR